MTCSRECIHADDCPISCCRVSDVTEVVFRFLWPSVWGEGNCNGCEPACLHPSLILD